MNGRALRSLAGAVALLVALGFLAREVYLSWRRQWVIATLTAVSGDRVQRDFAARQGTWSRAELGARFVVGDGVRTGPSTVARLRLADESELEIRPDTTLRFLIDTDSPERLNLDVEDGEAVVRSGSQDLSLTTHIGRAVLKAQSTVTLDRVGDDLAVAVLLGSLRFEDESGAQRSMQGGDRLRIGLGMAVLDAPEDAGSIARADQAEGGETAQDAGSEERDAADAVAAEDAAIELLEDGSAPKRVQLTAPAGESFVLHSPEVPVAIAFDARAKCNGEAQLELGKRLRTRGRDALSLRLPAGRHNYALRCLQKNGKAGRIVARGSVRIVKDAGTRKLPPVPPTSYVEADGRTYSIYYPNQLPEVSVRWPHAPEAAGYQLEIDGRARTVAAPEVVLKSGELRDGTHQLTFRGDGWRSRTTTVHIRFDNTAPTASLAEPNDQTFSVGDEVHVEGVALEGWDVSIDGGAVSQRADGRFSGTIVPSAERPDIAVRLSHPRLGIHYYLRRAAAFP